MDAGPGQSRALLEREAEVSALRAAMGAVRDLGHHQLVVVEGEAGIGKSTLLDHMRESARAAGVLTLDGCGGQYERAFAFGVVRQLFEPLLAHSDPRSRRRFLSGHAALTAPLLTSDFEARSPVELDAFTIHHALYWLVANIATASPVVLVVDDAHWSDGESLDFLLFLARRLDGLAVGLVLAVRDGKDLTSRPALLELRGRPDAHLLHPRALSSRAVAALIRTRLGVTPDPEFTRACVDATGGTPFLLDSLLRSLRDRRVEPTAGAVSSVPLAGPKDVAEAILRRLGSDGPALAAAEAMAVLGEDATLETIASLRGLDQTATADAVDRLVRADIVRAVRPVEFVHPIVRSAVYASLPPGRLALLHDRAAALLAARGRDPMRVAVHLLECEPSGRPEAANNLERAALAALDTGATDAVTRLTDRAMQESPDDARRVRLLLLRARAGRARRDPSAIDDFRAALDLADATTYGPAALEFAQLLVTAGRWGEAEDVVDQAIRGHEPRDWDGAARLRTFQLGLRAYGPNSSDDVLRLVGDLAPAVRSRSPGWRGAAALVCGVTTVCLLPSPLSPEEDAAGLEPVALMQEEGPDSPLLGQVATALAGRDELAALKRLGMVMEQAGRQRASVYGVASGAATTATAAALRGDLLEAETGLRLALELSNLHSLQLALPSAVHWCKDVLLERRHVNQDLIDAVLTVRLEPPFSASISGAMLSCFAARVLMDDGRLLEGIAALRTAGDAFERGGWTHPVLAGWRADLAVALATVDRDEAIMIATENLDVSRRAGGPRNHGVALRTLGLAAGAEQGLDLLRRAEATLRSSPAVLEYARTTVALGAALRRSNQREAARSALHRGLDLARRCGATATVELARTELTAAGSRLTREAVSGVESLTPTQRRVAGLAAEGMSNPEIAQALFVARTTVETHLKAVYLKLGIAGRGALAEALRSR